MSKLKKVWGGVIFRGVEYGDDDIAKIDSKQRMIYGIDWKYAGDCFFEECNVCVVYNKNKDISFGGRTGLQNALKFIESLK